MFTGIYMSSQILRGYHLDNGKLEFVKKEKNYGEELIFG